MYACFGVYDYFMPGNTIPPNQLDSAALIYGKNNGEDKNK